MEEIRELKKIVEIVLAENYDFGFEWRWRCHELARVIGNKLNSLNWKVEIKDGAVAYDLEILHRDFLASFFKNEDYESEEDRELENELREHLAEKYENGELRVFHSWCEVCNGQNEIIVIDWHGVLKLSKNYTLENVLIVEKKNNLPHIYKPTGTALFGKWIFFKNFPPYMTKLRFKKTPKSK